MNIAVLKTEIDTDPLVRGYAGMTDTQVADDINLVNRAKDHVSIAKMLKFLMLDNTYKIDTGDDAQDRSLWQRLDEVAAIAIPATGSVANPWGATAATITKIRLIKTNQLVDYFTLMAQGNLEIDLTDSNFQSYLSGAQAAGCMSTAQKAALLAISNEVRMIGPVLIYSQYFQIEDSLKYQYY